MSFSVNALFYGDHIKLARRCLTSIVESVDWGVVEELRLAVNSPTQEVLNYLWDVLDGLPAGVCRYLYHERDFRNVCKYPLMRRMLYDPQHPIRASRIMWFDDDSFVRTKDRRWWRATYEATRRAVLAGSRYRINLRGNQYLGIQAQPWYTGEALKPHQTVWFATGGWWSADREFLAKWDYPFPDLRHNGGDVTLGELCRQQGRQILHYNNSVAINADEKGVESEAERRGERLPPLWTDFRPGTPVNRSHHNFEHVVHVWPDHSPN